jgi:zinc protease
MQYLLTILLVTFAGWAQAGVQIQHWIAPTGAKVYFVESRSLPILDVQIDFAAGSAQDPADKSGVAGLTSSLLEAGVKTLDGVDAKEMDEEQISARLVDLGARLSSSADHDRASLVLRTLSLDEEKAGALALLRAVLSAPTFPESVLAREKIRSIESLKDAATRPDSIAAKRFAAALYPAHPYGQTTTPESVARITREDLATFHGTHFAAKRAVVSIIGDVSRAEAEDIARQLTADCRPAATCQRYPPSRASATPSRWRIHHTPHIHISLPAMRHPIRSPCWSATTRWAAAVSSRG